MVQSKSIEVPSQVRMTVWKSDRYDFNVAYWPRADMGECPAHVCFWQITEVALALLDVGFRGCSGLGSGEVLLPLLTHERHCRRNYISAFYLVGICLDDNERAFSPRLKLQ
jgi:hypothetical protein